MRRTSAALAAALTTVLVVAAAPAHARRPDTWTTISSPGVSNITEPGMYRTADGTLHIAIQTSSGTQDSLEVAHVTAAGKLTGPTPALSGWASVTEDADLVGAPGGGMRLVFGGLRTTTTGDQYNEGYLYYTSSDASGAGWALAPNTTPAIASPSGYGSYGTGVTQLADGTLVAAYPLSSTITYQVGSGPPQSFSVPECCVYDMTLVNDNGTVWAGWYANGSSPGNQGVFVRTLYPSLGPVMQAPGSATDGAALDTGQAVAMSTREGGGGVYLAYLTGYPSAKAVALWRVGDPKPRLVKHTKNAENVALGPGTAGRLWLAFDDGHNDISVVHTDHKATTFGELQTIQTPKRSTVYGVGIEGSASRGDLVFNNGSAILHQQVLFGLTIKASPSRIPAGRTTRVTFTVTDAGQPVKGAKVRARGRSCSTNAKGKCVLDISGSPARPFDAVATDSGYAAGEVRVKVRR